MSNVLSSFEEEFGLKVNEQGKIVTNSLRVADYYGKRHDNVMSKIRDFIKLIPELGALNFKDSYYLDGQSKVRPCFEMDRQGFSMLVNKFTGDNATLFTYKYTKAFEDMAEEIKETKQQLSDMRQVALSNENQEKRIKQANEIDFSQKRTVKTFGNCDTYDEYKELYKRFIEYIDTLDPSVRLVRYESAIKGMERLRQNLNMEPKNIGYTILIDEDIKYLLTNVDKQKNQISGGQKAALKRKNRKLEQRLIETDGSYIPDGISGVYSIQCAANEKRYIGISEDVARRFRQHRQKLNSGTHWIKSLQDDWNRYGEDLFEFEVIIETDDSETEDYFIDFYNAKDDRYGYNSNGGRTI